MTESNKAVMQNAYGHLRLLRKNVPYTMWTGIDEALAQLSAAIAQPEQPTPAPEVHYTRGYGVALSDAEEAIDDECRERVVTASNCIELIRNLGEAPQPAQPEQTAPVRQPLTNADIERLALANGFKLKEQPDGSMALNPYVFDFARAITAPVRQPLTHTEIAEAWDAAMSDWVYERDNPYVKFARAIEAKHNITTPESKP